MPTILVFRTGKTGTWREKLAGISAFAKNARWRIQPIDARSQLPNVSRLVAFWKPSGIIIDASGYTSDLDPVDFAKMPCVSMTPSSDDFCSTLPTVRTSSREIAVLAIRELLRREITTLVFMDTPGKPNWSTERREAFRDIAALHGFPLSVLSTPRELIELPRPIGLFAATDALAAEALVLAEHEGLPVPEDLSVVAVDDDPEICENCEPTLTSIRPDFHLLGFTAAQMLECHMVSSRRKIESIELPPIGLIHRASTMSHGDAHVRHALEMIRLRACEGISISEIASAFGDCSRRNAEMRFKAATGKTMTEAILEARLEHARHFLQKSEMTVAAIANFCGWKSDIAFRKAFKNKFACLPTDLRNRTSPC